MNFYAGGGKRLFDLTVSCGALVVLAPLMLLLAATVRLALGSPVIFRQSRPGRDGAPFTLFKFRTMTGSDGTVAPLRPDAERLTPWGRFLRSSSLDELPELWNVVRGDMSLVGPRPLLTEYLGRYSPEQARRHEVRPGITGWAQVNGRNEATWEDKFRRDVWYVDNVSLVLDLRILATTVWHVVTRRGISADGHATMPKFEGNED